MEWNGHICPEVLKWSQEAVKEVGLVHVLTILTGGSRSFWTGPHCKYSRDLACPPAPGYCKRFCLAIALETTYTPFRWVFCQHQSKLFVNNIYRHFLLSLKTLDFCSLVGGGAAQFGLLPEICTSQIVILRPLNKCFGFILALLFSVDTSLSSFRAFCHPRKCVPVQQSLPTPAPQPLGTTGLHSISRDLPILLLFLTYSWYFI